MIVFRGKKLFKRFIDSESGKSIEDKFSKDDTLLSFYNDSVVFTEGTLFKNVLWSFLNDEYSKYLFESFDHKICGEELEDYFRDQIGEGSKDILRNNIDFIEFYPNPIIGFLVNGNIKEDQGYSRNFLLDEKRWNIIGWKESDGGLKPVNLSAFSLKKILDFPTLIRKQRDVYDEDWNYIGYYEDTPSVSDILETICYEFYYYREFSSEKDMKVDQDKEMVNLNDLLESKRD